MCIYTERVSVQENTVLTATILLYTYIIYLINRKIFSYLVTMGSAAWLGPHRPNKPLPFKPVRPQGFLNVHSDGI